MSRKILEGSYEISPEFLFTGKHGETQHAHPRDSVGQKAHRLSAWSRFM